MKRLFIELRRRCVFRTAALYIVGAWLVLQVADVDCLREAYPKPSTAFPFLEPYLPYYDPIRDEPAFVELLAGRQ